MEELAGAGSVPLTPPRRRRAAAVLSLNGSRRARTCQLAMRIFRATAALAGLLLPWRFLVSV
jgi:hypothetical protein